MYICTPTQMKKAETLAVEKGASWYGLMERAGTSAAMTIMERFKPKSALVLCGKGNNGGDGFVICRLLAENNVAVTAAVTEVSKSGDAYENYMKIKENSKISIIPIESIDMDIRYDVIADAVFGTGFHGELPENIAAVFEKLNASGAKIAAIDIPSGADSISGKVSAGTLKCDITITFGALKAGMLLSPAKNYCGEIITDTIGIESCCFEEIGDIPELMDAKSAAKIIPERNEHCHKGNFGRLMIIAGSQGMSGAAALNVTGALRSGAGLVKLASVKAVIDRVGSNIYEPTFLELSADDTGAISACNIPLLKKEMAAMDVVAVGSGLTVCDDTIKLVSETVKFCVENNISLIIDADGLNCLAQSIDIIENAKCKAVLTPHIGELARLLGTTTAEIMSDRLAAAKKLASRTGAVVAAKGYPTYIVSPEGKIKASYTGNGGLSRGGSGDVLTGIISGIVSMNKGDSLFDCACAGVYVFGLAADIAADKLSMTGMLPSDAAAQLPFAFKTIGNNS